MNSLFSFTILFAVLLGFLLNVSLCVPLIPGIDKLGVGYDAIQDVPRAPVFEPRGVSNRWFFNSAANHTHQLSMVPANVTIVELNTVERVVQTFKTVHEYLRQRNRSVQASANAAGWFGGSASVQRVNRLLDGGQARVQSTTHTVALYRLALSPALYTTHISSLSASFVAAVQALPAVYNKQAFAKFRAAFGTHCAVTVPLGAFARQWTSTSSQYFDSGTEFTAGASAQLKFAKHFHGGSSGRYSQGGASAQYDSSTRQEFEAAPGVVHPPTVPWAQWVKDAKQAPAALYDDSTTRLVPLWSLMPASVGSLFARFVAEQSAANPPPPPVTPFTETEKTLSLAGCRQVPLSQGSRAAVTSAVYYDNGYVTGPSTNCLPSWGFTGSFEPPLRSKPAPKTRKLPGNKKKSSVLRVGARKAMAPLPGSTRIGLGFNAVTGHVRDVPVLALTTIKGKTHKASNGVVFAVPDQVDIAQGSRTSMDYIVINDTRKLSNVLASEVGVDASGPLDGVALSGSTTYEHERSVFGWSQSVLVRGRETLSLYNARLANPFVPTTALFEELVLNLLAGGYSQTRYDRFVDLVGTHVVQSCAMGGHVAHSAVLSYDYTQLNKGKDWAIEANLQWQLLQAGVSYNSSSSSQLRQFWASSFASVHFVGGNASLAVASQKRAWEASVDDAPAVVKQQLLPVTAYISDKTISAQLQQHLNKYYQQARRVPLASDLQLHNGTSFEVTAPVVSYGLSSLASCHDYNEGFMSSSVYYTNSGDWVKAIECQTYATTRTSTLPAPTLRIGYCGSPVSIDSDGQSAVYCPRNTAVCSVSFYGAHSGMYPQTAGTQCCGMCLLA